MRDRIAVGVVVLASAWFAFTAFWGLFGTPAAGHLGAGSAGNVMAAEQILRWHIVYPAFDWYSGTPPATTAYICHHPFGQYWIPAVFLWLFGHHDFVVRLPAALLSSTVPALLYGIASQRWGRPVGAVAAAAYVVVPIAVGFSDFTNLETFCIFGSLLFFWGHSRHLVSGRRRHLVASLVGLLFACAGDWAGYLLVAPALGWSFLRRFVLAPRLTPPFRRGPYARWWWLSIGVVAGTLALWIGLFAHAHQIHAWIASGSDRAGAHASSIRALLERRRDWIDFSFTPVAVALGEVALPVCALRLLLVRADEESYALSLLFGASLQYLLFEEGADVHIFWSIYFAPYYALALAQLAHTAGALAGGVAGLLSPAPARRRGAAAAAALAVGLTPVALMAHDGCASLWVWRRTGGRYDQGGTAIRSQIDLLEVLQQVLMPQTARGTRIAANGSAHFGWEEQWQWRGPVDKAALPVSADFGAADPFWIGRSSGLMADVQRKVASAAHVRVYGDTWIVDQREPAGPVDAYRVTEREPHALEWLLLDGTEPRRTVGSEPDPWLTWEWRTHLGQPAVEPAGDPATLDEMRIAFDAAIERGDAAAARRWRAGIDAQIDGSVSARFEGLADLVGVRRIGGVQPRLELWFEATTPLHGDFTFDVRSRIVAPAPWSVLPAAGTEREMAFPPSLPTKLWKTGFLYSTQVVLDHRIGRELYTGRWASRDGAPAPERVDGQHETRLLVLD